MIRAVHRDIDASCPKMVYIYWEERVLRTFPNPIHIHYGEGLRWVPLGEDEEFKAEFKERESPFSQVTFDGNRPRSGPAMLRLEKRSSFECKVTYGKGSTILEVVVEPVTELLLGTLPITIALAGSQIIVTPNSARIRKFFDQVEWHTAPPGQPFSVDFPKPAKPSPFEKSHFDQTDPLSGPALLGPGTYPYTVRYKGIVLDPGVEIEDP